MSAGEFVREDQTWPTAGLLGLEVLDVDGESAYQFTLGGPFEMVVIGPRGRDRTRLVLPLQFARRSHAERAAVVLREAFEAVKAIQAEEPEPCADHVPMRQRFSRMLDEQLVCRECGAELEEGRGRDPEDAQTTGRAD